MASFGRLREALAAEGAAALVTLIAADGSSPRDAGARIVVRPSGGFHGTIGGGALEWQAIEDARRAVREGRGAARTQSISLGPDLGQCCGGRVRILIETFDGGDMGEVTALAEAEQSGAREVFAQASESGRIVRRVGGAAAPGPGERREPLGDRQTQLLLFGAGHVGRALVLALAPLPFQVRWIDPRPDMFPTAIPANVAPVHALNLAAEIDAASAGAFVLVMTHSHPLDLEVTARALRPRRFPFVGLIGSETKKARFVSQMRAMGLAEGDIAALVCPIGAPLLRDKSPAVIAAATATQLLQAREEQGQGA